MAASPMTTMATPATALGASAPERSSGSSVSPSSKGVSGIKPSVSPSLSPSASSSTATAARVIHFELTPGASLGPFRLGSSLWRTIKYLRANQDSYPRVGLTWGSSNAQQQGPMIISPNEHLHLAFDSRYQRLQSITFETHTHPSSSSNRSFQAEAWYRHVNLSYRGRSVFCTTTLPPSPSEGKPGSRPALTSGSSRDLPLTRSAIHQLLGPTYPGKEQTREDGVAPKDIKQSAAQQQAAAAAAAASAQKKSKAEAEREKEFILSYPGIAFSFPVAQGTAVDNKQNKNVQASTMYIFDGMTPHDATASIRSAESSTTAFHSGPVPLLESTHASSSADVLLEEPSWIEDAILFPGEGVRLIFASDADEQVASHPPYGSATEDNPNSEHTSNAQHVDLILGETTVQDALCELGEPDAKSFKEDDRMQIHHRAHHAPQHQHQQHAQGKNLSSSPVGSSFSSSSAKVEHGKSMNGGRGGSLAQTSPFFFNYFSLGLDLYFEPRSTVYRHETGALAADPSEAVLSKVICHGNTPGHALFHRYQRLPWRFAQPSRDGRHLLSSDSANGSAAPASIESLEERRRHQATAVDFMRSFDDISAALTSTSAGSSTNKRSTTSSTSNTDKTKSSPSQGTSSDAGTRENTMLLDRSSDPIEFKGLLELDVRSRLHGFPGCILEVNESDNRVACVTILR